MAERKVIVLTGADGNDYDVRDEAAQQSIDSINNGIGSVPSGKTLQGQIDTINNGIGSVPSGKTVEGQIAELEANKVPKTRKVNNKALSSDVNLVGSDIPVSALDNTKLDVAITDLKSATTIVTEETLGITQVQESHWGLNNIMLSSGELVWDPETLRCSINEDSPLALKTGDIVGLTNYSAHQFLLVYKVPGASTYSISSFRDTDFIIEFETNYYIVAKRTNGTRFSDTSEIAKLFFIKSQADGLAQRLLFNENKTEGNTGAVSDGGRIYRPTDYHIFNTGSGAFVPSNSRVSFDEPVLLKKGHKISWTLGNGEEAMVTLFTKTGNTYTRVTDIGWRSSSGEYVGTVDYYVYGTVRKSNNALIYNLNVNTYFTVYGMNYADELYNDLERIIVDGKRKIEFLSNLYYNTSSHQFDTDNSRLSITEPMLLSKGEKIEWDVDSSEDIMICFFNKVSDTGSLDNKYQYVSNIWWSQNDGEYYATEDIYVLPVLKLHAGGDIAYLSEKTVVYVYDTYATKLYNRVDNIPSYWQNHMKTKISAINSAMDSLGGDGDAFVFITDTHWDDNAQKSPYLIKLLEEETSLRNVICGGDVYGGSLTVYRNIWDMLPNVFTCRGNHDQNPDASDETDIIPDSVFYNTMIRPVEEKVNANGEVYFFRDNNAQKIRYIFMDSGCAYINPLDETQLNWMKARVTELDSSWSVVIIQHWFFDGLASTYETLDISTRGQFVIDAINEIWDQIACTFIGILCGHCHRDYSTIDSTHGYPIIATTCDAMGTVRTNNDPINTQAARGTTTEQAFDVVLINKGTKKINMIRIGEGSNREFSY